MAVYNILYPIYPLSTRIEKRLCHQIYTFLFLFSIYDTNGLKIRTSITPLFVETVLPNHFQPSNVSFHDERMNPINCGLLGQCKLWQKVCETFFAQYNLQTCPITFKLHMLVVDDERNIPIDLETRVKKSRSTLIFCL